MLSSQSAEQVHSWLSRNTPDRPHPTLKRPINWMRLITSTVLVLGLGTALYAIWPQFLAIVQNRNVWAAVSLVLILLFTSGHMFNHIRKVPYVAANGRGGISYFAGGFQSQFGMETQIIAALCTCFIRSPLRLRRYSHLWAVEPDSFFFFPPCGAETLRILTPSPSPCLLPLL